MADMADNIIVAGLDQDYASWVEYYDGMTVEERSELLEWLVDDGRSLLNAPDVILRRIRSLASVAFLEVGFRWSTRNAEEAESMGEGK